MAIPIYRPTVGKPELDAISRVFESRWLGMGKVARAFEERIEQIVEARHAISVASGSAALHISLAALELAPTDEVIVPSMTFVSCPQAVIAAGARPVFCEVEAKTVAIDVDDIALRVTPRTRAVMPVHYAGFPCNLDALGDLARQHGFAVVEDAAHAFGSAHGDRMIGSIVISRASASIPSRTSPAVKGAPSRRTTTVSRARCGSGETSVCYATRGLARPSRNRGITKQPRRASARISRTSMPPSVSHSSIGSRTFGPKSAHCSIVTSTD